MPLNRSAHRSTSSGFGCTPGGTKSGGEAAPAPSNQEPDILYHAGARLLQDEFDSRRLADAQALGTHAAFTARHRTIVEHSSMFFLATADTNGRPDCSYKGGLPGFVRVVDERTLAFPNYDGNGMYKSLGNIAVNPYVGLLFVDFELQKRLRINGAATLHRNDPLLAEYPGAQLIVRVRADQIFPNCSRYVHEMELVAYSVYVPRRGSVPPEPDWKAERRFRNVLPKRDLVVPQGPAALLRYRARRYAHRKVVRLRRGLIWYILRRLETWLGNERPVQSQHWETEGAGSVHGG